MNNDTINLLKECNSGCKSAVNGIDQVLPYIRDEKLRSTVTNEKKIHQEIGDRCHQILNSYGADERDPHPAAKVFSWVGTEVKLAVNSSTQEIAGIMADGCNMGIKSINKALNEYSGADAGAKRVAKRLIDMEKKLASDMSVYL